MSLKCNQMLLVLHFAFSFVHFFLTRLHLNRNCLTQTYPQAGYNCIQPAGCTFDSPALQCEVYSEYLFFGLLLFLNIIKPTSMLVQWLTLFPHRKKVLDYMGKSSGPHTNHAYGNGSAIETHAMKLLLHSICADVNAKHF